MNNKFKNLLIPLFSVVLGLVFGGLLILSMDKDPIEAYSYLFGEILSPYGLGQALQYTTPLILTALGFSIASKAGFFNIGLSGQALSGWLTSVIVALSFPNLPQIILLPLCILSGMVAGALWAGIAGVLKAFLGASEVITTIMLNYIILYINDFLIRNVLTSPPSDKTSEIPAAASLKIPFLTEVTDNSTLHAGIFIAIIVAIIIHIILKRTTMGMEIRAVGQNKYAAEYAGMNAKKNIVRSMLISGALAGLAGVMEGLGQFGNVFLQKGVSLEIGFTGMAVSLLALDHPIGIIFSAFLFGIFKAGGTPMSSATDIPKELVIVITAIIIFFVGAKYIIEFAVEKMGQLKKKDEVK